MNTFIKRKQSSLAYRVFSAFITFTFVLRLIIPPQRAYSENVLNLPTPGTMITISPSFKPAIMNGITLYPENPLKFDFIIDPGDDNLEGEFLKVEANKLIKYFMASLTVPEEDLWVNLSPYEQGHIIPKVLGQTELGRDMLAQDYILKQLTASLMYPEKDLGKEFWDRVHKRTDELYGNTEIPVNTFNKVWIMPDRAVVYENGNSAYIMESHMKVMLEEDYVAMGFHQKSKPKSHLSSEAEHVLLRSNVSTFELRRNVPSRPTHENMWAKKNERNSAKEETPARDEEIATGVSSEIIREIIIPEIEKEINEGKNFSQLRQIYHSLILALWFKKNLKESFLGKVYANQNKILGIDLEDKSVKEVIYHQYMEAYKKGVYNYIREDRNQFSNQKIPRRYFSGGFILPKEDFIIPRSETPQENPQKEFKFTYVLKPEFSVSTLISMIKQWKNSLSQGKLELPWGMTRQTLEDLYQYWHDGSISYQETDNILGFLKQIELAPHTPPDLKEKSVEVYAQFSRSIPMVMMDDLEKRFSKIKERFISLERFQWKQVTPEEKLYLLQFLTKQTNKLPGALTTTDFKIPIDALGGKSLFGMLTPYIRKYASHVEGLKVLKVELGIEDISRKPFSSFSQARTIFTSGKKMSWGRTPREIQLQFVQLLAKQLNKKEGELTTGDFEIPVKDLQNKRLTGLLHFYGNSDMSNKETLQELKRQLGIEDFVFEEEFYLSYSQAKEDFLKSGKRKKRMKWDKTTPQMRKKFVQELSVQVGKELGALTSSDFQVKVKSLGSRSLRGLFNRYLDPSVPNYKEAVQKLKRDIGVTDLLAQKYASLEVAKSALIDDEIDWNRTSPETRKGFLELLSAEADRPIGALSSHDFTTYAIPSLNNKNLSGLLSWFYRKHGSLSVALVEDIGVENLREQPYRSFKEAKKDFLQRYHIKWARTTNQIRGAFLALLAEELEEDIEFLNTSDFTKPIKKLEERNLRQLLNQLTKEHDSGAEGLRQLKVYLLGKEEIRTKPRRWQSHRRRKIPKEKRELADLILEGLDLSENLSEERLNSLKQRLRNFRQKKHRTPLIAQSRKYHLTLNQKPSKYLKFSALPSNRRYIIQPYWEDGTGIRIYFINEEEGVFAYDLEDVDPEKSHSGARQQTWAPNLEQARIQIQQGITLGQTRKLQHPEQRQTSKFFVSLLRKILGMSEQQPDVTVLEENVRAFNEKELPAFVGRSGAYSITLDTNLYVGFWGLTAGNIYVVQVHFEKAWGYRVYFVSEEEVVGYAINIPDEIPEEGVRYTARFRARAPNLEEAREQLRNKEYRVRVGLKNIVLWNTLDPSDFRVQRVKAKENPEADVILKDIAGKITNVLKKHYNDRQVGSILEIGELIMDEELSLKDAIEKAGVASDQRTWFEEQWMNKLPRLLQSIEDGKSSSPITKGGIDFKAKNFDIEFKKQGNTISNLFESKELLQVSPDGFSLVFVNSNMILNLPLFLESETRMSETTSRHIP